MKMPRPIVDTATRSHWGCRSHGTINRNGEPCRVCEQLDTVDRDLAVVRRIHAAARSFSKMVVEALNAVGDAMGQW